MGNPDPRRPGWRFDRSVGDPFGYGVHHHWFVRSGGLLLLVFAAATYVGRALLAPLVPAAWAMPMWVLVLWLLGLIAASIMSAIRRRPFRGMALVAMTMLSGPALAVMARQW
ncbi:hypothetical protein [Azospirillum agricola]|uniref:hypothetical protein n=1 Tax=Azospirillum agricola TaxID=1720247 RepID=UPI000A0F18B2|nr:hypothetical protein [Azospirillum agricola]SMH58714.1 hypothetical protein SAMN02982994_4735 [Azospirillum lipoferum]